ncbi:MAG: UvrD-helicase domain-containing protein [Spirochaetia bacterium]|nr:UvrD-helicase domain-containing protein [Spirochaetia bacterium]
MSGHKVVEASAGTGKTYWIEQEVMRLIEAGVPLPQILLVTFTEKATTELHQRIRTSLKNAIVQSTKEQTIHERFIAAERELDQASIFTIHGFCNQMLNDFAFEMQEHFAATLVNDAEVRKQLLAEIVRSWPERFGEHLPDILSLSSYPDVHRGEDASAWETRALSIAMRMGPRDRLIPEDPLEPTEQVIEKLSGLMEKALSAIGSLNVSDPGKTPLFAEFRNRSGARADSPEAKFLIALGNEFKHVSAETTFRRSVRIFLERSRPALKFSLEDATPLGEFTRNLQGVVSMLGSMQHYLMVAAVRELQQKLESCKQTKNLRSYDDMLSRLHDAVMRHELVCNKIRQRYAYAIVDEFQDTDPIQWEIFQKLFVGSEQTSLILVGDPKQAIYGFRGANVRTYNVATNYLLGLSPPAENVRLGTSYRSSPELMEAVNALFASTIWFGKDYKDVLAAPIEKRRITLVGEEPALNFLDLQDVERAPVARRKFSEFAANEILRMMNGPLRIADKGANRPLRFSDFAVLVKAKSESPSMERAFRSAGIPHAFYKKPGVYESKEAMEWALILKATDTLDFNAMRKALLTRFFSIPIGDLLEIGEIPPAILDRFRHWNSLAIERRWSAMFSQMLLDTPILLPGNATAISMGTEFVDPTDDFERRRANLEQIAQDLELSARQRRMNLSEMIDTLAELRVAQVTADESTLHSDESDADRVRIMTIHASKGLEFPFVFITGGFYDGYKSSFSEYFASPESQEKIFDLVPEKNAELSAQTAEDLKRLYYVAFTRAQFKIYAPLFKVKSKEGPVSSLIYPAATSLLPNLANVISIKREISPPVPLTNNRKSIPIGEIRPYAQVARRARGLTSYSSILRLARMNEAPTMDFGIPQKLDESQSPGTTEEIAVVSGIEVSGTGGADSIPGGARTGDAVHSILEKLDFATFDSEKPFPGEELPPDTLELIRNNLVRNGISEKHQGTVINLIWATLNTELPEIGKLAKVTSFSPEMTFMLAVPEQNANAKWEQIVLRKGFIYGAMDLVFRQNQKYYVLDWKTNKLPVYTQDELEKCMQSSHYDLQYEIYSHALISWLSSMPGYEPEWFGGVFYLFLRGMRPGSNDGVFFRRPNPDSLLSIGEIVRRAFRGTH